MSRLLWSSLLLLIALASFETSYAQKRPNDLDSFHEGFNPGMNLLAAGAGGKDGVTELAIQELRYRRTFVATIRKENFTASGMKLSTLVELPALDEYVNSAAFGDADNDGQVELILLTNRFLYVSERLGKTWGMPVARWYIYDKNVRQSAWSHSELTRPGTPLSFKQGEEKGFLLSVGDVTNNDRNEIVLTRYAGKTGHGFPFIMVTVLRYGGERLIPIVNLFNPGMGWEGIQILDFDGDGNNELVLSLYHAVNFWQFNPSLNDFVLKPFGIEFYPWLGGQRLYFDTQRSSVRFFHAATRFRRQPLPGLLHHIILFDIPEAPLRKFNIMAYVRANELNRAEYWKRKVYISFKEFSQKEFASIDRDKFHVARNLFLATLKSLNKDFVVLNTDGGFFLFARK